VESISKIITSTPLAMLKEESTSTHTLATLMSPWDTITMSPLTLLVWQPFPMSVDPSIMAAEAPVAHLEHRALVLASPHAALLMV
jgi:hypothetical protein